MTLLKLDDKVPIELQLGDGAIDLFPQAWVFDDDGNLLATINLVYDANSWYYPLVSYLMPNKVFISVVYIVYTDAGHTIISNKYERVNNTFIKVDPDQYKADVSNIPTTNEIVNAIESSIVEGTLTNIEIKRIMFSALAGICSGGCSDNVKFRDVLDLKDRINATVDSMGNRSEIVLDGS
jgi:predicted nucleotidyltransferase